MSPSIDPADESPFEEPVDPTPTTADATDLMTRLDAAARRLDEHARLEKPTGLTEPDEGGTERWEAGQVWTHIAEFVPYWHHQVEAVIGEYDGTPVPFGRMKTDPDRLAAIEMGHNASIAEQAAQTAEATNVAKRYLEGLTSAEWSAKGLHPIRGEMDVEAIVERFLVDHLEEHAQQLDGLRRAARSS
jgi:hypothetical protein